MSRSTSYSLFCAMKIYLQPKKYTIIIMQNILSIFYIYRNYKEKAYLIMILNVSIIYITLLDIRSFLHTESPIIVAVTAVIGTCLAIANLLSISRDSRART